MEKYHDEKTLSFDQLLDKNIKMVESNRFLTKEEKAEKISKLKNAEQGQDMRFKTLLTNPSTVFPNRTAFVKMAIKKLMDVDFEAFKECYELSQPRVEDMELIPIIVGEIAAEYPKNIDNYPIILAVLHYLVAPAKNVHQDVKLPIGMRDLISHSLGFANPETVNAYSSYILPNFKNPRFKAKVITLGDKIYNELKEAGFLNTEGSTYFN